METVEKVKPTPKPLFGSIFEVNVTRATADCPKNFFHALLPSADAHTAGP